LNSFCLLFVCKYFKVKAIDFVKLDDILKRNQTLLIYIAFSGLVFVLRMDDSIFELQ